MRRTVLALAGLLPFFVQAQSLTDANLRVDTVLSGLSAPTGLAFSGAGEGFVIQKNDGVVQHFANGTFSAVLDLDVQRDSERGLLGITLDPGFASNGLVYLQHSTTVAAGDSSATDNWADNRVTRYRWDGNALVEGTTLRTLGSASADQPNGPNHNGGPILFGPDGKLYGATGDLNRDLAEQNEQGAADISSSVGGIFRLEADGSAAAGNPFAAPFEQWYAYGVRNSFGLAFDPVTGRLWDTENGPGSYDEINLVDSGFNSGWREIMGPDARNTANAPDDLVMLPGASYSDPAFSFLTPIGITAITFLHGSALGPSFDDAVLVGNGRFDNGEIYLLRLNAERDGFVLDGVLADGVADAGETGSLVFGQDFGIVTDMEIGPDGALYVTSLTQGAVYRVSAVPEPALATMFAGGLVLLCLAHVKRSRAGLVRACPVA